MASSEEIIKKMNLILNTDEGGYFKSTYPIPEDPKSLCSAIYYFLDTSRCSVLHKVGSDMLYHFYFGEPVEMLLLYPPGHSPATEVCVFYNDVMKGLEPMKVIPAGTWLGSRIAYGGHHALMGVSMAPQFDPATYVIGDRDTLLKEYPEQEKLITELTNPSRK